MTRSTPRAGAEERAADLTEFWRKPDGSHDFATWLRLALEDILVLDAAAFEVRKNRGGAITALEINFINSLVDTRCQVTPAVVYVWAAQNYLPVSRIGSRIVASKTAIRAHLFRAAK